MKTLINNENKSVKVTGRIYNYIVDCFKSGDWSVIYDGNVFSMESNYKEFISQ